MGEIHVERRQRHRLVVDHLDRRAAAAEYDHRAEGRIVGDAEDQFARRTPHDHRLDRHTLQRRIRPRASGAFEHRPCRFDDAVLGAQVEDHAADFGRVPDVAREHPDHDRVPLGEERQRLLGGALGAVSDDRRHDRNAIGLEQSDDLGGIEPGAPFRQRLHNHMPRRGRLRREHRCDARRGRGERRGGLAIAHQIHEGADCVVLGREVWNAGRLEDRAGALIGADPCCKHQCGDRTSFGPAVTHALRHRLGNALRRRHRGFHVRDQDRIVVRVIEQRVERDHVTGGIGIACDVDGIG